MKIKVIDSGTKRTLANTSVQLQVKGKDSGFLSLTTDSSGNLQLDDKYKGQQIATVLSGGGQGQWITASDGATLNVDIKQTTTTKS